MRQPRLKLLSAGVIQNDEVQESVTTQQPGSADGYKTVSSKKSENTQKMWFLRLGSAIFCFSHIAGTSFITSRSNALFDECTMETLKFGPSSQCPATDRSTLGGRTGKKKEHTGHELMSLL